jgi:hypothetical protein
MALLIAAACLARLGEWRDAATILGHVDRPAASNHRIWTPNESPILEALSTALRASLAGGEYEELVKGGEGTSLPEIRELAFTLG